MVYAGKGWRNDKINRCRGSNRLLCPSTYVGDTVRPLDAYTSEFALLASEQGGLSPHKPP